MPHSVRKTMERVEAVCDRHLPPGALSFLKEGVRFPVDKDSFGKHIRAAFGLGGKAIMLVRTMMEEMRDLGLLSPCPNNGPRGVSEFKAWNDWLEGHPDPKAIHYLERTPAFDVLHHALTSALVGVSLNKERRLSPDGKIDFARRLRIELDESEVDAILADATGQARSLFTGKTQFIRLRDYRCRLTGMNVDPGSSPLAPVLHGFEPGSRKEVRLDEIEPARPIRHLELPLPSGRLAMSDWFRVDGFNEGIEAILGADLYEINYAKGLDERAHDYFTRLGLVIIQVGNTSPWAYAEGADIWRMGRVNEDHDLFWTKDGDPNGVARPEPAWVTCTDLWANVMADHERIVDILMASGRYGGRSQAGRAIADHCETTYGVSTVDIGARVLHVYSQTGGGYGAGTFDSQFSAPEIERRDWQEDHYILSGRPLSVPDVLLEKHDWTAGSIDPAVLRALHGTRLPVTEGSPAP